MGTTMVSGTVDFPKKSIHRGDINGPVRVPVAMFRREQRSAKFRWYTWSLDAVQNSCNMFDGFDQYF
jgi:hypothetical protein